MNDANKKSIIERIKILDEDSCWEWIGHIQPKGYGIFDISGKKYLAHRLTYEIFIGEIPEYKCVCHKCDNRKCCNPKHLFTGTIQDNNRDRHEKGRTAKGEAIGSSKLSYEDITDIRLLASYNLKDKQIAEIYHVSRPLITMIRNGNRWQG